MLTAAYTEIFKACFADDDDDDDVDVLFPSHIAVPHTRKEILF